MAKDKQIVVGDDGQMFLDEDADPTTIFICTVCDDTGWVCENHQLRPWGAVSERHDACECGAGAPCRACGPAHPPGLRMR